MIQDLCHAEALRKGMLKEEPECVGGMENEENFEESLASVEGNRDALGAAGAYDRLKGTKFMKAYHSHLPIYFEAPLYPLLY